MIDLLVGTLYQLGRWRAFLAWAMTAAVIYPVMKYIPNHHFAWNLAVIIAIGGFVGGLYWEIKHGSN